MIHLEHAWAIAQRAAIRIRVQPRAEHHKPTHAALKGGGQSIFREARSHRDEDPYRWSGQALLSLSSDGIGIRTKDAQGQRIGENATVSQHLMSGAVESRRLGRPARLPDLHTL